MGQQCTRKLLAISADHIGLPNLGVMVGDPSGNARNIPLAGVMKEVTRKRQIAVPPQQVPD